MATQELLVFDIKDFRGKRVVFTKEKLAKKRVDHPELDLIEFLRAVKVAIQDPIEVWPDAFEKEKECYYGKYREGTYAKVVVYMSHNRQSPSRVVSAYEIDKIKETKYKNVKRVF